MNENIESTNTESEVTGTEQTQAQTETAKNTAAEKTTESKKVTKKDKKPTERKLSPEAQAKLDKASKAKKGGKGGTKKESRITAAVKVLRAIDSKPVKLTDAVTKADTLYVKGGGPSNVKEALWSMRTTIATMVALELIDYDNTTISKAKAAVKA